MTITEFAQRLSTYCFLTRASVTSWGRTEARNRAVGGVPYSAHRFFLAVDLVYDVELPLEERKVTAERLGLRLIAEDDHDHLQPIVWGRG